jgi:ADP-ribose pyrophosphatase
LKTRAAIDRIEQVLVSRFYESMNTPSTQYPQTPRVAVGAVVSKDGAVLLVRRGKAPSHGKWAIPGGSVELGETLQQAAEREIFEETGLLIQAGQPVYTFDLIEHDRHGNIRFHYVIVDLSAEYLEGEPVPGDDADQVAWVPFDELPGLDMNAATRAFFDAYLHKDGPLET